MELYKNIEIGFSNLFLQYFQNISMLWKRVQFFQWTWLEKLAFLLAVSRPIVHARNLVFLCVFLVFLCVDYVRYQRLDKVSTQRMCDLAQAKHFVATVTQCHLKLLGHIDFRNDSKTRRYSRFHGLKHC